jgi:hypothetical protein
MKMPLYVLLASKAKATRRGAAAAASVANADE